ncbi:hypothetical protein CDL15_Pgr022396 [Punica granatum]|uniref:Uncharacterized protein n=1 Tax=Punica granatum TaxID=22663 RepID=A0A218XRL7_PUNGR|nr:hypothetical protein CDL15_Pgr022396 [Punica granatum]PKI44214.1 hypothetical protein CRG98_035397 [Punica granatum]
MESSTVIPKVETEMEEVDPKVETEMVEGVIPKVETEAVEEVKDDLLLKLNVSTRSDCPVEYWANAGADTSREVSVLVIDLKVDVHSGQLPPCTCRNRNGSRSALSRRNPLRLRT